MRGLRRVAGETPPSTIAAREAGSFIEGDVARLTTPPACCFTFTDEGLVHVIKPAKKKITVGQRKERGGIMRTEETSAKGKHQANVENK